MRAEGMPVPRSRMEALKEALKPWRAATKPKAARVRKLTKQTERLIRGQVGGFAAGSDKRAAIAARARLSEAVKSRDVLRETER